MLKMSKHKLKTMKEQLLKHGKKHIALGLVSYFSETILGDGFKRYETWLNRLISQGISFNEIYKECVIPSPCWMVYREDLDKVGAFSHNRYPEDYDLAFRFYQNQLKCIASDQVLHYWRDYSFRTSRTHENYADNGFLAIKMHYFLELDYDKKKNLVVWGAGKKGKTIAQTLLDKKIDFSWVCDNPKKIGKEIYGKILLDVTVLNNLKHLQSIITVANPMAQNHIKAYLYNREEMKNEDCFFFC